MKNETLDIRNFTDFDFDGASFNGDWDALADAVLVGAWHKEEKRKATMEELDYLSENYADELYEIVFERAF